MVPPRACDEGLLATENQTVPLPEPLVPEVMVIQLELVLALQLQPACALTFTEPFPPEAGYELLLADRV